MTTLRHDAVTSFFRRPLSNFVAFLKKGGKPFFICLFGLVTRGIIRRICYTVVTFEPNGPDKALT